METQPICLFRAPISQEVLMTIGLGKPINLGPGSSNNINEFNEANFKLAFNLEYRFPLTGPLKGGLFIDAGNVWNIFDDVEDPAIRLMDFKDLSEIAIGSGIGLRYDFDFFVFRFDTGFKTYNPALPIGERWWNEYNLKMLFSTSELIILSKSNKFNIFAPNQIQ